jgi:hypothetical protein
MPHDTLMLGLADSSLMWPWAGNASVALLAQWESRWVVGADGKERPAEGRPCPRSKKERNRFPSRDVGARPRPRGLCEVVGRDIYSTLNIRLESAS